MAQSLPPMRPATAATRLFAPLLLLAGALLLCIWAWANDWPPAVSATDIDQHRANIALPAPTGAATIRQSFTPTHDGLAEVELLLVRYGEPAADTGGELSLQLFDDSNRLVAERQVATAALVHNQTFVLRFPPQPNSAGRPYTLQISGNDHNPISAWGYDLDVHSGGSLTAGDTTAQDLRLVTRYRLTPAVALASLLSILGRQGLFLLLALLFVLTPGCLLLLLARHSLPRWDAAVWLGAAVALGLSIWPLLWLWLTLLGGRFTPWLLWLLLATAWLAIIWLGWRNFILPPSSFLPPPSSFLLHPSFLLLLLLLIGLAVRLLAVRDLAFPPWVDSSRHALITAVMAENGQAISDYNPFLPVDRFPYHFGFHTVSAALSMLTQRPLPDLLLFLGQLFNALTPLTVYAAAWLMTRRRTAALVAAFLVALPFFFPAYYATWGRLTQLTAMLVMPIAIAVTWQLVRGPRRASGLWWLLACLAAGLFLIHFRVFLVYLPFAALVWLATFGRHGRRLLLAAALALLLLAPRLGQLAADTQGASLESGADSTYNAFPIAYVNTGWERPFLWLALISLLIALPFAYRRRPWATLPPLLALWAGLLLLLLSGRTVGLPESWLININSAYITLFLPLALLLGLTAAQLWRWLQKGHWLLQIVGYTVAGVGLTAALLFGLRQQVTILNQQTILAQPADLAALQWLAANTPAEAKIAVNSWRWLGVTWAGSDGGAWLLPLTGRQTTTPPADYIYSRPLHDEVNAFNEQAMTIEDWRDPAAAAWLHGQGVTHIFVGARGGFFHPAELAANPSLTMIYAQDGVFVWEIQD